MASKKDWFKRNNAVDPYTLRYFLEDTEHIAKHLDGVAAESIQRSVDFWQVVFDKYIETGEFNP